MSQTCHIVGCGLVTPLGATTAQTWQAILAGRHITDHTRVPGFEGPARFDDLAHAAATQALAAAGWPPGTEAALILATSKGPIDQWITPPGVAGKRGEEFGPALAASRLIRRIAAEHQIICRQSLVVCAACTSGVIGLIRAAMLIESGQVDRVLIVAAETSVSPLFIASFSRLGILPRPEIGCRPFDESREGFSMSEAAAAICLEARPGGGVGRVERLPRIERFACGSFATHLTATEPDGRTMAHLLRQVLPDGPPDVIHAHGTATTANDPAELSAIESALPPAPPPSVYSHKAALGHSQGAAGLISAVLNCQMHQASLVPGNVCTTRPLATSRVRIDQTSHERPVHRSVVLASGFGGSVAAVSLSG